MSIGEEKPCCIIDSWFSDRRRMGLTALVSGVLAVFSILLNSIVSFFFGKNELIVGITMMMAFVFIAGFAVAVAVSLILYLEKKLKTC